ncbi:F-box/WD repeat-containing protein 1A [Diplogelasinospora grovesii]|uniref:F-box/WD repeat-containing protein 1A n=1 Tax=Diplogelasinospora grovesii TaxID=303347 RepID=A0AAN6RZ86_9PEZI|nr:F-box/WD repeat-containing protein 1A [Diplogelasinospora grovesii]
MDGFPGQPDEGYSEDPLTGQLSASPSFLQKPREDAVSALGAARSSEFPAWLTQHIANLSVSDKTDLTMALLSDLPTSVISQIVNQLNPRLYIDFVRYLPPEVCLKILGFLDPLSLINVARSCRTWYDLALDRKLWEQLYYMEGWKAKPEEIGAWERRVNGDSLPSTSQLQRALSEEDGHAHKKRAITMSPALDADSDMVMLDAENSIKQEPADMEMTESSIFGDPNASFGGTGISQRMSDLDMRSAGSASFGNRGKAVDKGKGKAVRASCHTDAPHVKDSSLPNMVPCQGLQKSTLWMWDGADRRFKINWKYLYTMRRQLESNWELGRFANFQLPHPDFPEEGHGECIYSLQYNAQYLVSGSRDRTLKVWDMETRRLIRTLAKHRGSVLCLQFDSDPEEDIIVSGSSDSDVIIWKFSTGQEIQTLRHAHRESVLNVKFDKRILVTCSKDKTIKIFNRKPLHHGDHGFKEVDPVPKTVNYGYSLPMTPDDLPQTPPWTLIACLEGHGAAVNAVQIHGREVVSASGDRHIKVWDWPSEVCIRTIVGHTKGIACVQYDGRRIVSGSSDNEVKVFDRETGLEVASLRSHSNLVRTVQAGFGDLPYSIDEDAAEAKKVDAEYFKALESGRLEEKDRPRHRQSRRPGNAGSKRPEDITAYGAKLPPGGGGGKYGRIVSGSYDTSIIIWRRDKEGVWKDQHHLKQEEAAVAALRQGRSQVNPLATAAGIPLHPSVRARLDSPNRGQVGGAPPTAGAVSLATMPGGTAASLAANASPRTQTLSAPPTTATGPTNPPLDPSALMSHLPQVNLAPPATLTPQALQYYHQIVDQAVQGGHSALARALVAHPPILTLRNYVEAAIDRQPSPVLRSQLRQAFSGAIIRAQFEQARQRREAIRNQDAYVAHNAAGPSNSQSQGQTQTQTGAAGTAPAMPGLSTTHRAQPGQQAGPGAIASAVAQAAVQGVQGHLHAPPTHLHQVANAPSVNNPNTPAPPNPLPAPPNTAHQLPPYAHHNNYPHHPHLAAHAAAENAGHDAANPARVFKLQYDARRIICCSQTSVIVGWDFCNGDPELEEASRFFGPVV